MRRLLLVVGVLAGSLMYVSLSEAATPKYQPYIRFANPSVTPAVGMQTWKFAQLCQAYSFPTKLKGGGVIGIIELGGGWVQSDLDAFSTLNSLPKITVTNVSVDGAQNSPGVNPDDDGEVALDIECIAATYYYCTGTMPTIKVFFCPNSSEAFVDGINAAVANGCDVLSISWGLDEADTGASAAEAIEVAATSATGAGLAIFCSAGDYSSDDSTSNTQVSSPASCPHIVSCGGTNKTNSAEVVWGDSVATDPGTGGGYSAIFPIQSFQIGAPKAPAGLGRMVPDVASDADPYTGTLIYVGGQQQQVGGTSGVAPLYSALFASFGKKLGYVTPKLWKNQTAFADITSGSNGAYSAATGPDACTGIGVPIGTKLSALFVTAAATPPVYNYVASTYSGGTLTLTGDAGANTVTVSVRGTILTVAGSNLTLIGSASSNTSQQNYTLSGNLKIVGNFAQNGTPATNDSLLLASINSTSTSLTFGTGNDSVTLTYCTITQLTAAGGTGTNTLTELGSAISASTVTNFTVVK